LGSFYYSGIQFQRLQLTKLCPLNSPYYFNILHQRFYEVQWIRISCYEIYVMGSIPIKVFFFSISNKKLQIIF
jgi:hypothetical protein